MMCLRSLSRPGLAGLPAAIQRSRDWPPFQARVVKPRISTLTAQRSRVRARISALIAATVIGRPRIDPELSINNFHDGVSEISLARACGPRAGSLATAHAGRAA